MYCHCIATGKIWAFYPQNYWSLYIQIFHLSSLKLDRKIYNRYVKYFFLMWYFSKQKKSIFSWLKEIFFIIKTWFIIVVFYYFDFRETGSIILATNKIFYSLGPNVYVVLFLLYSNICQRMSENWNRFLKYKQIDLDRFHRNSLLNRFAAWSMINLLSIWSIYKIKMLNYCSFLHFNQ